MPTKADLPSTEDTDSIIHIDADSKAFAVLLDLVTAQHISPAWFAYRIDLIKGVLLLGQRYGFDSLPRLVVPSMYDIAGTRGWEVFTFAAKYDFPVLAAYAIDNFQASRGFDCDMTILNVDFSMFDGISSKFTGPLIRNMTLFRTEDGRTDWRKVSRNFPIIKPVSVRGLANLTLGNYPSKHSPSQARMHLRP
jgi:hypothetical protein